MPETELQRLRRLVRDLADYEATLGGGRCLDCWNDTEKVTDHALECPWRWIASEARRMKKAKVKK